MSVVLVLNTGSSSIKHRLVDTTTGERLGGGVVEEVADIAQGVRRIVDELDDVAVDAVGHRVAHGGETFTAPTVVDDRVVRDLRAIVPLAPLHNPANIAGIDAAREAWPDVPHVAVFDTAFHRTLPPHAYRYAVPSHWYAEHGVRRYGFHGTSVAYVARRAAEVLGRPVDELDLIVAHLGNGSSITAVHHGESVETSMGLTPLEGLVMGTRSGDVDPAVVGHVAAASGRDAVDVLADLNRSSGLLGLAGASDMREITERAAAGDADAKLALDVFAHRVKRYVGGYLAVLGRCDAVVFTAGIGEHSAVVRAAVLAGLAGLGISIEPARNERSDVVISPNGSPTAVLVIPTDEELEIARQVDALVLSSAARTEETAP